MEYLFVYSKPPHRLLWFYHKVRRVWGIWSLELRATWPIKVSCRVAICFLMLGILKNFLLTVLFVMCWSFTSAILMPNMRRMLQCSNTSSFFIRDAWISQFSHYYSNIFMGMARRLIYLLQFLTLGYVHNLARAPIDAFPDARCADVVIVLERKAF